MTHWSLRAFPWRGLAGGALALTLAACGGGDGTTATTQSTTSSTSPVLQMDALKGNEAADTLQMQIKSVKQSTSERVTPRAITLEPLMGAKAAAISAPTPGRPLQIGVARSVAGRVASSTAKPWFWLLIMTWPLSRSSTG